MVKTEKGHENGAIIMLQQTMNVAMLHQIVEGPQILDRQWLKAGGKVPRGNRLKRPLLKN